MVAFHERRHVMDWHPLGPVRLPGGVRSVFVAATFSRRVGIQVWTPRRPEQQAPYFDLEGVYDSAAAWTHSATLTFRRLLLLLHSLARRWYGGVVILVLENFVNMYMIDATPADLWWVISTCFCGLRLPLQEVRCVACNA